MGKWICDNPKTVKKLYTNGITGITSVLIKIKTSKENHDTEQGHTGARTSWAIPGVYPVTGPELEKIANVVFMDLLKSNKKFIAKLKKMSGEKTTEIPPDTGKIFRRHITSF